MKKEKTDAFFNLYAHGFIRAAVCIPEVRIADPAFNAIRTLKLAKEAVANKAILAVFPELGLSAYSNEDLFHQDALLAAVRSALQMLLEKTRTMNLVLVVGTPLQIDSRLFNCAVVLRKDA